VFSVFTSPIAREKSLRGDYEKLMLPSWHLHVYAHVCTHARTTRGITLLSFTYKNNKAAVCGRKISALKWYKCHTSVLNLKHQILIFESYLMTNRKENVNDTLAIKLLFTPYITLFI